MPITTNILANGHSSTIVDLLNPKVKTNDFKKSETIDQPDIYDPAFVESENAFLSLISFSKPPGLRTLYSTNLFRQETLLIRKD